MNRRKRRLPDPSHPKDETVTRLKKQIARGRYRVDADAVAREILSKLRLLGTGRRALTDGAARAGSATSTPRHE
jgi:Anti-sigma-28 factor, FlgM